ncbi:TadE family type IV pilus minor pilin [Saccharopolyspora sp. NPDC000359]|uniref:TadE family type IV pilus minor pilin n=1 Tax=Saccharopolyspora sp. NPDC000359 TaxID=3154251 RepID=UPI003318DDE4
MAAQVAPVPHGAGAPDRGAVTVEAALGICSVVAVFALVLVGTNALIGHLRCTDAAVEAARLVARGDRARADGAVQRIAPAGAALAVQVDGDVVRTEVSLPLPAQLPGRWLHARAVAVLEPGVVR